MHQLYGVTTISNEPSTIAISVTCMAISFLFALFVAMASFPRTAELHGYLSPTGGTVEVATPISGILKEVRVNIGEKVRANQILFAVSTQRNTYEGNAPELIRETIQYRTDLLTRQIALRREQGLREQSGLKSDIDGIAHQLELLGNEIMIGERRLKLFNEKFATQETLRQRGFINNVQYQQAEDERLDAEARLSSLRRAQAELTSSQKQKTKDLAITILKTDNDLAMVLNNKKLLEQESVQNSVAEIQVIRAPSDGEISEIHHTLGNTLQTNQSIATFLPSSTSHHAGENEVILFSTTRSVGFIKEGQQVSVKYEAYPYQKFGSTNGIVKGISVTPINPQDLPLGQAQNLMDVFSTKEPLFKVVVKLKSQTINLYGAKVRPKAGMQVSANIVLETKKIYEWITDPLRQAQGINIQMN